MEFQFQKDFIFRKATASDRAEVLSLFQKYRTPTADVTKMHEVEQSLQSPPSFANLVTQSENLFLVALNSNGVMIGFLFCSKTEWVELVVNPNFMKHEVKVALVEEVKKWANAQGNPSFILLKPKLITGDWKAFVKKIGCRIEGMPGGQEKLFFA